MPSKQIIAMGGGVLAPDSGNFKLERYILDAAGKVKPRVLFMPAASGDSLDYIARFYEAYSRFDVTLSHLALFKRTPVDLQTLLLSQDVIHVGGGNTRSMLAVWGHWGIDRLLRRAWENGVVLCGSSAGMICWFDEGVTDSIAGDLTVTNALGFLRGSACPHYDGEKDRRPTYERMVADGIIGPGIACDDGAAVHFIGETIHAVVNARPAAAAYRVAKDPQRKVSETRLPGRTL